MCQRCGTNAWLGIALFVLLSTEYMFISAPLRYVTPSLSSTLLLPPFSPASFVNVATPHSSPPPAWSTWPLLTPLPPPPHHSPSSFVNVATRSGFTPLHYAVAANFPNLVALLLSNGASMCCRTSVPEGYDILSCENWSTPLHLAAMKGRTECALALLKYCVSAAGACGPPAVATCSVDHRQWQH